jgi:hypothetical protein
MGTRAVVVDRDEKTAERTGKGFSLDETGGV